MNQLTRSAAVTGTCRARRALLAVAVASALPAGAGVAWGQISYTTPGASYTQDFNTLPNDTTTTDYSNAGTTVRTGYAVPSQPTRSGMFFGTYTPLPGWYFGDTGGNTATALFEVGTGSGTAGATYSFGSSGSTERALGALSSGGEIPTFGVAIKNDTGTTLNSFSLGYRGEQWRQNIGTNPLGFSYLVTGAFDANDVFTPGTSATGLNFASLVSGTGAATDGNATGNFTTISGTVTGFTLNPGEVLWLRWNKPGSNSTGLAIDDLVFSATAAAPTRNLTWNPPGTTWTTGGDTNWLDGGSAAAWADNDNATFGDTGVGAVNVDAAGVVIGTVTIANASGTYSFSGGAIGGLGGLVKNGAGTVEFNANNTYTGGSTFNGGVVRSNTATPLGTGAIQVTGATTLEAVADTTTGGIAGSAVLTKTGTGTLTVATDSGANAGGSIVVSAGTLRMNHQSSLGGIGSVAAPAMAITLEPGTELITAYGSSGFRQSGNINLNGATITRPDGTPDGDSAFDGTFQTNITGTLTVTGNSTLQNLEQSALTGPIVSGAPPQNNLGIRMPVVVTSGATLTMHAANTVGDFGSHAVSIRGAILGKLNNPGDAVTVQAGGTIVMSGPGEKRFGATNLGKPIVGEGTSAASDAVLKLDKRTFMTDLTSSADVYMTRLVVAGTGDGGLRIEAPMNAVYHTPVDYTGQNHPIVQPDGDLGLFGVNLTSTQEGGAPPFGNIAIGNAYTVMSPKRYNELSEAFPGKTAGGTLTLAATDATAASGVVDNGPGVPVPIKLALDNAATSGNLTYVLDTEAAGNGANGANLANFGGLIVKRSNAGAGTVTAQLAIGGNGANTVLKTPSVDVSGARLDLQTGKLITQSPVGTFAAGAYTGVSGLVDAGRGAAGNAQWDGNGIVTSDTRAIASSDLLSIGVVDASDKFRNGGAPIGENETALFAGQVVTGADTLVMVTYGGDANLDGKIDIDDYGQIDSNVAKSGTVFGWNAGDFNYDGQINIDDYGIIDGNIGRQGPAIPAAGAALDGVAAVPEPASLGVLAVAAAAGLLGRRRRAAV